MSYPFGFEDQIKRNIGKTVVQSANVQKRHTQKETRQFRF